MNIKKTKAHEDGAPWEIVTRFPSYEEADTKRLELQEAPDLQVKVHYQGPEGKRYYAVKTRMDPSVEASMKKKEEKSRRQKKLQKKRRKR